MATKKNFTQESANSTTAALAHAAVAFATKPADDRPKRNRKEPTIQLNVRVSAPLREKLRNAAFVHRMSERDLLELLFEGLPDYDLPSKVAPTKVSVDLGK